MKIDMEPPYFARQRVRRALDMAVVFWILLTALMVAAGSLLPIGSVQ